MASMRLVLSCHDNSVIRFGLKALSEQLQMASFLDSLDSNSSNVLSLIVDGYNVSNAC